MDKPIEHLELKQAIIAACLKLEAMGYVIGTYGNASARSRRADCHAEPGRLSDVAARRYGHGCRRWDGDRWDSAAFVGNVIASIALFGEARYWRGAALPFVLCDGAVVYA